MAEDKGLICRVDEETYDFTGDFAACLSRRGIEYAKLEDQRCEVIILAIIEFVSGREGAIPEEDLRKLITIVNGILVYNELMGDLHEELTNRYGT